MKKFSKILSVALLVALVLSLGITNAFAEPQDTTLKVNAVDGHKYTAFQLFVGDLDSTGKKLSNVKWGADVASSITYYEKANAEATTYTEEKTISPTAGAVVPAEVLDYLSHLSSKTTTDVAQDTADIIGAWVTGSGTEIPSTGLSVKTGYYVVKDAYTNANNPQTTTLSTLICEIVGPTTVTPKAGTTIHKKEVLDVNDSEAKLDLSGLTNVDQDNNTWSKTADHDFGDHVPFKLTTTIASDYGKYEEYYLAISDKLGAGLKLDTNSFKVYVDGKAANTAAYEIDTTATSTYTFKVIFENLKLDTNAAANKDVVVYYTAELDKNTANIGKTGNLNESWATFSNNPNDDQEGTADTPHDTVIVFTYKMDVDKIDGNFQPLQNAGFTLYKQVADEASIPQGKSKVTGTPAGATADTFKTGIWYEVGSITAGANTSFEFPGIDDGTYILVESTTPDGYNTMAPITIHVTATHSKSNDGVFSIDSLSADNGFVASKNGGSITMEKTNNPKTLDSGEVFGEVINQSGVQLPSTGGIGTTIFYAVGGILVLAAIVLLITKKRMSD